MSEVIVQRWGDPITEVYFAKYRKTIYPPDGPTYKAGCLIKVSAELLAQPWFHPLWHTPENEKVLEAMDEFLNQPYWAVPEACPYMVLDLNEFDKWFKDKYGYVL